MDNIKEKDCGISKVTSRLGGKWKLLIVWRIHQNEGIRFNRLQRVTIGITNVMLSICLKELILDGFVSKKDFGTVPTLCGVLSDRTRKKLQRDDGNDE